MDFEYNQINIENEDDILKSDEMNNSQLGNESFTSDEEDFSPSEENDSDLEENNFSSSDEKKPSNDNKPNDNQVSKSLGSTISAPASILSVVTSMAIIGTTAGIIPALPSHHVSMFLARSHQLGFEVKKEENQKFLLTLSNEEESYDAELIDQNYFVFDDLLPSTTYNLTLYDMEVKPYRKLSSASYQTKDIDKYSAEIADYEVVDNMLNLSLTYIGEDIHFVTLALTGEDNSSIYLYEGAKKEEFNIDIKDHQVINCSISINGEKIHYEQILATKESEDEIPAESIQLGYTSLTLNIGQYHILPVTVLPENTTDKTVTFTSSDDNIVEVTPKGILNPKAVGQAIITARTKNNKTATCSVTVKEAEEEDEVLALDLHEATLNAGESLSLNIAKFPMGVTMDDIIFESDNIEVADVDQYGEVYALMPGQANITIKTNDGLYQDTCHITVNYIKATSITLNSDTLNLEVGQSQNMPYVISPRNASDQNVVWESDNEDVATVSDGLIQANAQGQAQIKASLENGEVFAICQVNVTTPIIPVESITISQHILTAYIGNDIELSYEISPDNATYQDVIWSSSNESVATVENGLVHPLGVGTARITVATADGEYSDYCNITVKDPTPTFSNFFLVKNISASGQVIPSAMLGYEDPLKVWNDTFLLKIKKYNTTDKVYEDLYTFNLHLMDSYYDALKGSGRFYIQGLTSDITDDLLDNVGDYKSFVYTLDDGEYTERYSSYLGFTNAGAKNPIPGTLTIEDNYIDPSDNRVHPVVKIAEGSDSTYLEQFDSFNLVFSNEVGVFTYEDVALNQSKIINEINIANADSTVNVTVIGIIDDSEVTIIEEKITFPKA